MEVVWPSLAITSARENRCQRCPGEKQVRKSDTIIEIRKQKRQKETSERYKREERRKRKGWEQVKIGKIGKKIK